MDNFEYPPKLGWCTKHGSTTVCKDCEIARLKAELEKIADQCLKAMAGTVCTPVEGYVKAGMHWIASDIRSLVKSHQGLERQLAEAKASAEAWQENCRLTEEELEKERNKHADIIGKLAERDAEVATLRQQSINWVPVFDANMELQTQNAALREEVERLKVIKWVQTESYEAVAAVEQARQEAAREIVVMLRADRWAESELAGIKAKFKLEGGEG